MKFFLILPVIFALVFLPACAPSPETSPTRQVLPDLASETAIASLQVEPDFTETSIPVLPSATAISVEVSTAVNIVVDIPTATETVPAGSNDTKPLTVYITMEDNGKTINMKVGDSFLLKLGSDFYDWSVDVDNQDVISREIGITAIRGAQGIYLAHAPGSTKLTASGNPQCLNSTPPCLAPSILFEVTVIVQ